MSSRTAAPHRRLTDGEIQAYRTDGFIAIQHLFPPEQMLRWKQWAQRWVNEAPSDEPRRTGQLILWSDIVDETLFAEMHEVLTPMLQQLIGPRVDFLSAKAVFKSASLQTQTNWHQDWHYWKGSRKMSVWIPLDDATPENGCLMMIPGSHKSYLAHDAIMDENEPRERLGEAAWKGKPATTLPIERGGAIFFTDWTLHASHPNSSGKDRWTMIPTYRNADEPDNSTGWKSFRPLY